jgi:hypothetical protein
MSLTSYGGFTKHLLSNLVSYISPTECCCRYVQCVLDLVSEQRNVVVMKRQSLYGELVCYFALNLYT